MNLLDAAILIALALFMLSGLHKGFLWTAISAGSIMLCIALAFAITPFISNKVVANEKMFNSMLYYMEGSEYIYDVEYSRKSIAEISNAEIEEIYNRSDVAYPMNERIRDNISEGAFAEVGIVTLGDYFNRTMVLVAINILVFILVYVALRAVMLFALGWWNYAKSLPKLKRFDILAGLGMGLIRGVFALFLIFMLCPIVLTVLPFEFVDDMVQNSTLASFFYRSNIFLRFISGS